MRILDIGTSKHKVEKGFVSKELVKESADMHALAITAQNECVLKRGVGVPDDANVFAGVESAVAKRTITYAVANQLLLSFNAYAAGFNACCDDD